MLDGKTRMGPHLNKIERVLFCRSCRIICTQKMDDNELGARPNLLDIAY